MAVTSQAHLAQPLPRDPVRSTGGTTSGSWSNPTPPPVGTVVPTVSVNANGLLELPYDQNFASNQLGAVSDANNQLLGIKQEQDQQGLQYQQGLRQATQAYGQAQRTTKNEAGATGTLFSSKYGTGVSNNAALHANQVGEIESANSAFEQNAILRKTAIQTALQNQLAAMAQEYTDKLSADAGNLGYGQSKNDPKNTSYVHAITKAKTAYGNYESAYNKAKQLSAVAAQSGKPADRKRAAAARQQAAKLSDLYKRLKQTAKDYK